MPGTSSIAREMGYMPGTASTKQLPQARKGARFITCLGRQDNRSPVVETMYTKSLLRQCVCNTTFLSQPPAPTLLQVCQTEGQTLEKNKTKTLGWLLCEQVRTPSVRLSPLSLKIKKSNQKVLRWATTSLRPRVLTCQMGLVIVLNSESNCAWYELSQCLWNGSWAYNRHLTNGNYYAPFHTLKKFSEGNLTKNKLPKNTPKPSPGPGKDITFFPRSTCGGCYPPVSPPAPLHTHAESPSPTFSELRSPRLPPTTSIPTLQSSVLPTLTSCLPNTSPTHVFIISFLYLCFSRRGRREALGTGWKAALPPAATPAARWPPDAPFSPQPSSHPVGQGAWAGGQSPSLRRVKERCSRKTAHRIPDPLLLPAH